MLGGLLFVVCHSAVSLSRPDSMVHLGACIGRATCCLRRTSDEISDSFEEKLNLRLLLPASSLNFGQHRSREAPKCSNEQDHCRLVGRPETIVDWLPKYSSAW